MTPWHWRTLGLGALFLAYGLIPPPYGAAVGFTLFAAAVIFTDDDGPRPGWR